MKKGAVLIYVDECIWPIRSGFHRRVWQIVDSFAALGTSVTIAARHGAHPRRCYWTVAAREHMCSRGIELHLIPFNWTSFDFWWSVAAWFGSRIKCGSNLISPRSLYYYRPGLLRRWEQLLVSREWDAVLVNHAYHYRLAARARMRRLRSIIDMHDLLSEQMRAHWDVRNVAGSETCIRQFAKDESFALDSADIVLAINPLEALAIQKRLKAKVIDLPFCLADPSPVHPRDRVFSDLLVVGSGTEFNRRGLREFMQICWPKIVREMPTVRLSVCGAIGEEIATEPSQNITWHKQPLDLSPHYEGASIVLLLTVAGTGIKIKTVEALAHGSCIVAHNHSVLGLDIVNWKHAIIFDSFERVSDILLRLLRSDERIAFKRKAKCLFEARYRLESQYATIRDKVLGPSKAEQAT